MTKTSNLETAIEISAGDTSGIPALAIEAIERDAWLDIFRAAPGSYVTASGLNHERLDDAAALAHRGVPITEFNRVFSLGLERPASLEALQGAVAWLRSKAAPGWAIQLSPFAAPSDLSDWLRNEGLEKIGTGWAKFHQSAWQVKRKPRVSSFEIKQVDGSMAQDFGHVVQTGFGLPEATAPWFSALVQRNGWNTYLALDGGRPVGACAMFIKDGWAWLGVDATLADARGRGAQTDLIAQRLEDGLLRGVVGFTAETGYPPAGQETTYQSYRNYLKADFALAYVRPNYKLR